MILLAYQVFLHPKVASDLDKFDRSIHSRLQDRIRDLQENPFSGDRLKPSTYWRTRVGDYRIIYEIHEEGKSVIVLYIGHRKHIYDDFSKLL